VKFETRQGADTARRALNGTRVGAYTIRVVWHHTQSASAYGMYGQQPPRPFTLHVQYECESPQAAVSDAVLWQIFAPFGEVVNVSLPPNAAAVEPDGTRKGYGFVVFSGAWTPSFVEGGPTTTHAYVGGPLSGVAGGNVVATHCGAVYVCAGSAIGRRCAAEAIKQMNGQVVAGLRLTCAVAKKHNVYMPLQRAPVPGPLAHPRAR
jgi:hypothetical protein